MVFTGETHDQNSRKIDKQLNRFRMSPKYSLTLCYGEIDIYVLSNLYLYTLPRRKKTTKK